MYVNKNYLIRASLTDLRICTKILSLNMSVNEPNITQHVDITNESDVFVLNVPINVMFNLFQFVGAASSLFATRLSLD